MRVTKKFIMSYILDRNRKQWGVVVPSENVENSVKESLFTPVRWCENEEDAVTKAVQYGHRAYAIEIPWGGLYIGQDNGWVCEPLKKIETEQVILKRIHIASTSNWGSQVYLWVENDLPYPEKDFSQSDPEWDFLTDLILRGYKDTTSILQEVLEITLREGLPPEVDPKKLSSWLNWLKNCKWGYEF